MSSNWIPEIMYEEDDGGSSTAIPFIMVPQDEVMPKLLYIFESRETGEFEPGQEGDDLPVVQWDLHQYADMVILKDGLDPITYDMVRAALGLEPMIDAVKKGQKISESVKNHVE
jgi:hypothetical protein